MKKSFESQAVRIIAAPNSYLSILHYGLIAKGNAFMAVTDLDHYLVIDHPDITDYCGQSDALFDLKLYMKTGNMAASVAAVPAGMEIQDFPCEPDGPFNPDGRLPHDLIDLVPALSKDVSKTLLQYILVHKDNQEAVATDGWVIFKRSLPAWCGVSENYLVSEKAARMAALLAGNVIDVFQSDNKKYVRFNSRKSRFTYRQEEISCYPDYRKILPDLTKKYRSLPWGNGHQEEIRSFLDAQKPYFRTGKNAVNKVYFSANRGYFYNQDLNYKNDVRFFDTFFPHGRNLLGFSVTIFYKVLEFIRKQPIVYLHIGEASDQLVVFIAPDLYAGIMPVRTGLNSRREWTREEDLDKLFLKK